MRAVTPNPGVSEAGANLGEFAGVLDPMAEHRR